MGIYLALRSKKAPRFLDDGAVCIPLTRGFSTVIDAADLILVQQHTWHIGYHVSTNGTKKYYAKRCFVSGGRRRNQYLHTFLTGWPRVDHRDGDGLNNRRLNLRQSTQQQNCFNRAKQSSPTSSRFKGVSWNAHRNNWRSVIRVNGKTLLIGDFKTEIEAAAAYRNKASQLLGEFMPQQSRLEAVR